jgi:adenosylcobinamide-GDP ribazoletransferase
VTLTHQDSQEATDDDRGSWLRLQPVAFVAALQFLTLVPPLIRRMFTSREMGAAVGYFPAAGLVIGLALAALNWGLGMLFPGSIVAGLLLVSWLIITGALHLDGFLDSCDGLLGGFTPESRMRIMRDESVGSFALAGGVMLLLLKYAALAALVQRGPALVVAAMLGRWGMALSVKGFPYARLEGVGRTLKDNVGWRQIVLATGIALLAALLVVGWKGIILLVLAGLAVWAIARFTMHKIPGLTGDIYGATCELVELIVLLALVALERGVG